jgi:hypothetical protein
MIYSLNTRVLLRIFAVYLLSYAAHSSNLTRDVSV